MTPAGSTVGDRARGLRFFRHAVRAWGRPENLSLALELDHEDELPAALGALSLSWPESPQDLVEYQLGGDCSYVVGRHHVQISIGRRNDPGKGLETSHVDLAYRIEDSLERAGILPLARTRVTVALAHRDPEEYRARYQEMSPPARIAYVARLSDEELSCHLDLFLAFLSAGRRPRCFHMRVSGLRGGLLWVRYAMAYHGDDRVDRPLGELDATPGRLAALRRWMLAKNLDPPWIWMKGLPGWNSGSYDERLARVLASLQQPRVVGIELGIGEPWSERGEPPVGNIKLVVRLIDHELVNVLATLLEALWIGPNDFADKLPAARDWANATAAALGVPCTPLSKYSV